jgi:hypothetical protein
VGAVNPFEAFTLVRRSEIMEKLTSISAVAFLAVFGSGFALAQSSGSFSATGTSAACTINSSSGFLGGTSLTNFQVNVQTSNGNGVALLIRPSLVTGLFTSTKITTTVPSASADVGIKVCVTVDGSGAQVGPTSCVVYDQRFQQISSNLFSQLAECTAAPTTTACTVGADCAALGVGFTCGSAGVCVGPNPLCDFGLILSTLSAHSFDFVVSGLGQGTHNVDVTWSVIGAGVASNPNNASVASCVGPGILTVTQVKNFNQNSSIFFSNN